jgi:bifunctional DNA-binding transcriptional regulator/antitoxin component of YhaV-PrlF toxin-antitoxin module
MAIETKRKIFRVDSSYVLVLPKSWVEMHNLDKNREVIVIVEPDKITIMPSFENGLDKDKGFDNKP